METTAMYSSSSRKSRQPWMASKAKWKSCPTWQTNNLKSEMTNRIYLRLRKQYQKWQRLSLEKLRACWISTGRLTYSFPLWPCTTLILSRNYRKSKASNKNCNHRNISIGTVSTSSQARSLLSLRGLAWYAPCPCGVTSNNGNPSDSMPMMLWSSESSGHGADVQRKKCFGWTRCLTSTGMRKPLSGYGNRRTDTIHLWKPLLTVWCRRVSNQNQTDIASVKAYTEYKFFASEWDRPFRSGCLTCFVFDYEELSVIL